MKREKPISNEIYHIYNRGVEKRNIFMDNKDRIRFIHDLFEFNDQDPAPNLSYYFTKSQSKEVGLPNIRSLNQKRKRKLLVEILAFCLMPNHFHLLVKQKIENGIPKFMQKLGTGYTNYFNQKYERVGSLFQGKYKFARVKDETYLLYLSYYIHLNPLDLKFPNWRNGEIKNYRSAMKFLENYRWSSFLDYIGKKNFPSITQREFLNEFLGGPENYKKDMMEWLKNIDIDEIKNIVLE